MFKGKVHISTLALITIALFDLVTTLIWLHNGMAEGNAVFAWMAAHGSFALVFGKLLFLVGPVLILEYARTVRPLSAEIGTWIAASLYAYLYVNHLLMLRR
jgi:hypothetical protein